VTKTQLARWHRAGLLARPVRRQGLGRGKGTVSIYPPGTGKQLLALVAIHSRERRLPFVAWKLWWEGHNISTQRARAFLDRIAVGYERAIHEFITDGTLTKSGEALLKRVAETRGEPHVLLRVRKRVGKKLFPRFMFLALEVLSGKFTRWRQSDDPEIVERGVGFTLRARTIPAKRRKLRLKHWTTASVGEMSRSFPPSAFRQHLELATDNDLERARDEVRTLLGLLTGFGAVFGRRAPLLALFRELDATTPLGQAMFLMLWLVFRQGDPALQTLQLLQMLATKIPAVEDLLTPERFVRALRSKQTLRIFETELQESLAQHRGEVEALHEQHPEFREVFGHIRILRPQ